MTDKDKNALERLRLMNSIGEGTFEVRNALAYGNPNNVIGFIIKNKGKDSRHSFRTDPNGNVETILVPSNSDWVISLGTVSKIVDQIAKEKVGMQNIIMKLEEAIGLHRALFVFDDTGAIKNIKSTKSEHTIPIKVIDPKRNDKILGRVFQYWFEDIAIKENTSKSEQELVYGTLLAIAKNKHGRYGYLFSLSNEYTGKVEKQWINSTRLHQMQESGLNVVNATAYKTESGVVAIRLSEANSIPEIEINSSVGQLNMEGFMFN